MDQFERLKVDIEDSRADLQGICGSWNARWGMPPIGAISSRSVQPCCRVRPSLGRNSLGMLLGPRRLPSIGRTLATEPKPGSVSHSMMGDVMPQAWDNIKTALIGMAAARLQDVVEEVLPGFKHH